MRPWIYLTCLLLASACAGCIWDRDTLANEANGIPDVISVITGRFERNPPRYYEMRLERVAQNVRQNPDDLALYDDAGAACDRLGRGDEAIAWMDRKREVMDRLKEPASSDHRYRYHANLGTFLAHRWFKNGANPDRIDEMKAAAGHIRKAIKINPNAHFGREKYQLIAMEWILAGAPGSHSAPGDFLRWRIFDDIEAKRRVADEYRDAPAGLAGLVVLGNAWESVDVFHALAEALARERKYKPAYLAELRCVELIDSGANSLQEVDPAELRRLIARGIAILEEDKPSLRAKFRELRADADRWHEERTEFMLAKLHTGSHPDWDANFWDGYRERPAPSLNVAGEQNPWTLPAAATGLTAVLATGILRYRRRQRRRYSSA